MKNQKLILLVVLTMFHRFSRIYRKYLTKFKKEILPPRDLPTVGGISHKSLSSSILTKKMRGLQERFCGCLIVSECFAALKK